MAKIKELLTTQHGSHLYGLAHEHSDHDIYEIYTYNFKNFRPHKRKQAKQTINDTIDTMRISLDRFEDFVCVGVPQSLEALFSTPEHWIYADKTWPAQREYFINRSWSHKDKIMDTYRRTACNFMHRDDVKKNRHAFRLCINAHQFKTTGYLSPTMNSINKIFLQEITALPWQERYRYFKQELFETFG